MKATAPYVHRLIRKPMLIVVVMAATFALATMTALMQKTAPPTKGATPEVAAAPDQPAIAKEEKAPDGRIVVPNVISGTTYAFTSASGVSLEDMSSGTTTIVAPNQDDAASPLFDIGFEFWFDGTRQTQFSTNANGLMRLGPAVVSTAFTNSLASATDTPQIAPYWDDLWLGTNGKVHYKVVGSAPSRKLVVEWQNMQVPRLGTSLLTGAATFQAWLYEGTGVIEFVYGSGLVTNSVNGGYSVGFGSSATQFASVTTSAGTVAYGTANNTQTNAITSGTKYTFTPLAPTAPSGFNVTAITQTGMTLNWTDNSSSEVGFAVYRSDDGGTTYNFISQAAANASSLAVTNLLPGVNYFWRVLAVSEGNVSAATSGSATTNAAGTKTAATGNWNTAGTWTPSGVPTATDNVTIPDGVTVTLDATGLACNNLTVGGGTSGALQYALATAAALTVNGSVTVNSGASFTAGAGVLTTHTLAVGGAAATVSAGSITNNGTFDMNTTASAAVTFGGNISGALSGSGGTFDFFSITLNKGTTSAPMLDVTSPITMSTVSTSTNRLVLTSGTFRLSSASSITPIGGSQTVCAAAGRLWLNNAGAVYNSGSAGSPTVTGELRIDGGTFNYGTGNNTMAVSATTGILTMNGGTLNMLGAIALNNSTGTQFVMSGGSINVDPNATNALATGTATFSAGASTTVNWTGGTITIVDPHSAAGGAAFSAAAGGAKLITGGTLNIGDGTSTTASGALSNTTGFGLTTTMGVWNLNINNRTDASNTRMARMTGSVTVFNQLTLQANSYLFLGSGATAASLFAQGNVAQGGTMAGCEPAGTQLIGTLQMQGFSGTQTVSGGGTYTNIPTLNLANQGTGVTFTNTSPFVVNRVNLFSGSINIGTMFTIGRPGTGTSPVVQIGGFSSTVAVSVGSFNTLPTFDNTAGVTSYLYSNTSTTLATGAFNEMPAGAQTLGTFLLNDVDGITVDRQITASFLTLSAGIVNMSGNLMSVTNTATTAITGGTATAYVKGALARTLPASLATGSTYTFPIGKSGFNLFEMVNPTTNAGGTVVVQAEVFDADSGGTAGTGVDAISHSRYWQATITSGAANFTNTTVRLTEIPLTGTRIAQSSTQMGTYNSIGGTVVGNTVLSNAITSLDYFALGFLAFPGGTYTVGAGGNYGTLTAAFTDMNSKTLTGPVVLSLTAASYSAGETFPL
ncbi:MAG TPA: fibronectin type III domain-containing protein, partial [Blastocatellia bacterium]|nr:fibronectin type III domain-containing protein [Blastocatellia bacterium]